MGRYIKNTQIESGSYAARVPHAISSVGPTSPVNGMIKYDDTTDNLQFYKNSSWNSVPKVGSVTIQKDTFVAVSPTIIYGPMVKSYNAGQEASVLVFIGNVFQNPGVAFTFDGSTNITFTSVPPNGQSIIVLHNYNSTNAA